MCQKTTEFYAEAHKCTTQDTFTRPLQFTPELSQNRNTLVHYTPVTYNP
jgi:hypothetical protein